MQTQKVEETQALAPEMESLKLKTAQFFTIEKIGVSRCRAHSYTNEGRGKENEFPERIL
jgi:hypothetical protein